MGEVAFTKNPVSLTNLGTDLKFYLSESAFVSLKLFDQNGRLLKVIMDGSVEFPAGFGSIRIDSDTIGHNLARGLYII